MVTVPGREFGMEGHLRMSFCGTIKEITEGIERIKWALDPNAAQRTLPGRPKTGEGLAMNPYLDLPSPAQPEAGKLAAIYGLQNHGLTNLHRVYWNLPTASLYEEIVFRGEARISHLGPVVVSTGKHTARAAADKFIVQEHSTEDHVWWGEYNRPFSGDKFSALLTRMQGFLQSRDVFVQDCYAGADPGLPPAHPHHHREGLAQPVRAQHVHEDQEHR